MPTEPNPHPIPHTQRTRLIGDLLVRMNRIKGHSRDVLVIPDEVCDTLLGSGYPDEEQLDALVADFPANWFDG